MNDTINGRVLGKDLIEALVIGHIDLIEVGAAAAQQLNAVEGDLGGVVEGVDDDDVVAVLEEGEGGEATNVAGATASGGSVSKECSWSSSFVDGGSARKGDGGAALGSTA